MFTNDLFPEHLKEETYIRLYFSVKGYDYKVAGIVRAFRDMNRPFHKKPGESQEQRNEKRLHVQGRLQVYLEELINISLNTQAEFDCEHKRITNQLITDWPDLTIGLAQKWINMSLKYWLLLGDVRIKSINRNAAFFHIPLDEYVLKGIFNDKKTKWSKIEDYDSYIVFQERFRSMDKEHQVPIVAEALFFNRTS